MEIEEPATKPRWGLVWGLLLVLGGLAALPFLLSQYCKLQPETLPAYQIQNFIGSVEVYASDKRAWVPARRGEVLKARDKVRTGPEGEIDLRVPDQISLRIKENSEVEVRAPGFFEKKVRYRLHLLRGSLVGSTEKSYEEEQLEISTLVMVAAVRGTSFQIESNPDTQATTVRVLKGSIRVRSKSGQSVLVQGLERTEVKGNAPPLAPVRVSRKEWDQLKEAYELTQKSAALEARQLDLSKQAGGLFQHVFDHGTFYTPKFGFADREFIQDEATGKVHLEVSYDVFPTGSFVGMYMKTRDLDLSKFKGLKLQARGNLQEGYPDSLRIELKSSSSVIRAFAPRDFKEGWQSFVFPFRVNKPTPISEVTLVFSNEKSRQYPKGKLYLRDVDFEPVPPGEAKPVVKKPVPSSPAAKT